MIDRVLVTNLFRDQLDRYGELDTTAKLIRQGIDASVRSSASQPKQLILNADDPLVARIPFMGQGPDAIGSIHYFGVRQVSYQFGLPEMPPAVKFNQESAACPACGHDLTYDYAIYGHLGHYRCQGCSYQRPPLQVEAENVIVRPDSSTVHLRVGDERLSVELQLPGLFNVYNFLAAVAVIADLGVSLSVIVPALQKYQSVFGRAEKKILNGKQALVMLIKNPVGASEVIKLVAGDPKGRLWVALNDNYADGRDVSWIWDAQFEWIAACGHNKPIIVSGVRADDMAVRLKYAGIPASNIRVERDLLNSVTVATEQTKSDETLYLMPTYTALLALRQTLSEAASR